MFILNEVNRIFIEIRPRDVGRNVNLNAISARIMSARLALYSFCCPILGTGAFAPSIIGALAAVVGLVLENTGRPARIEETACPQGARHAIAS